MNAAAAALVRLAGQVVAAGTNPEELAAVVAYSTQPRRHPDQLRRRIRDEQMRLGGVGHGASWSQLLAVCAGTPSPEVAGAAFPLLKYWRDRAVRVALVGDSAYPAALSRGWPDLDAPTWIAWRGAPPSAEASVAIVGARRATSYGTGIASWLAQAASAAGITVVSGGAVGIDAAAHEAAMDGPGGTTVVLGCGHGVDYPRPHARPGGLFDRVVDEGGTLVSESLPFEPPRAHQIRSRNRIVAGLSSAVVVVEGGERSGSLLTASAAADRGIPVLAVPGDVRAPGSVAPHRLITEGATPCCSPAELLEALGRSAVDGHDAEHSTELTAGSLPPAVHGALQVAWPRALSLEQLASMTGASVGSLLASLTRALVNGEIAEGPDGLRLRRAP